MRVNFLKLGVPIKSERKKLLKIFEEILLSGQILNSKKLLSLRKIFQIILAKSIRLALDLEVVHYI